MRMQISQLLDRFLKWPFCRFSSILGVRTLLCLAVAAQLAQVLIAEDLYVSAAATPDGDGSLAHPYWRITDAVVRARNDRQRTLDHIEMPVG